MPTTHKCPFAGCGLTFTAERKLAEHVDRQWETGEGVHCLKVVMQMHDDVSALGSAAAHEDAAHAERLVDPRKFAVSSALAVKGQYHGTSWSHDAHDARSALLSHPECCLPGAEFGELSWGLSAAASTSQYW